MNGASQQKLNQGKTACNKKVILLLILTVFGQTEQALKKKTLYLS